MKIFVASGKGHGKTPLSAFDAALQDAGISNYNLIILSSVIPPESQLIAKKFTTNPNEYGQRLYIVKAEIRSREAGKYIGAALGWYQLPDGRGVFVEHEEIAETKKAVESNLREDIHKSLSDLCKFRGFPIVEERMKMQTSIIKVLSAPACALVIAVYKSEPW